MHSRFDQFRATPLGRQLEALLDGPGRYVEYAALSRAGVPAVAAVIHDLETRFPEVDTDAAARQFCGAMVAEVMRRHHHDILRPRGRVPGGYFTYGAVWTPLPARKGWAELLAGLAAMPEALGRRIADFAEDERLQAPPGMDFSLHEHVCHLRDLEIEAYRDRIERVLAEDAPVLMSVDGTAWAAARNYPAQDFAAAVAAFEGERAGLVDRLAGLGEDQRRRYGLFDGIRRMTIEDLVADIHDHDRTHLQEVDELAGELGST